MCFNSTITSDFKSFGIFILTCSRVGFDGFWFILGVRQRKTDWSDKSSDWLIFVAFRSFGISVIREFDWRAQNNDSNIVWIVSATIRGANFFSKIIWVDNNFSNFFTFFQIYLIN